MDPTMGETNIASIAPAGGVTAQATFGDPVPMDETNVAVESNVVVAAPSTAPETSYPVGTVDFNKPFEVFDANDDETRHTNARVLAVLAGNNYPVVVVSHDGSEEVVTQFDTDGDSIDGELKVENIAPAIEQTKFVAIFREGRGFASSDDLYDTESAVFDAFRHEPKFFAAVSLTIPAHKQEIPALVVEDDEEGEGDDADAGPKYINGMTLKAGDKVRSYRRNRGSRTCTILKTRDYPSHKQLFIKADNGQEQPYWALNKNISPNY
ncbi:hypothetical protein [Bradyrhizobium sp. SZCCHNRI2010]|uniref:hypothetical protein n=1 Tax=Bradyrhizobium sp. SZCCHNRI2010 TaxID=3057283 RepID=UPI0028F067AE|nr:hypothetical protein [Bradyrhizobium sp. SZCCHNRI2010]